MTGLPPTHLRAINVRLWFSAIAYVLIQAFRQQCLARTPLAKAQTGTIRTLLLKLGARVLISVRRVLISISSSCPYQDIEDNCLSTYPGSPRFWIVLHSTSLTHKTLFQSWLKLSAYLVVAFIL